MIKEHFSIGLEADLLVKYEKWIQIMFRLLPKSWELLFCYGIKWIKHEINEVKSTFFHHSKIQGWVVDDREQDTGTFWGFKVHFKVKANMGSHLTILWMQILGGNIDLGFGKPF